MTGLGRRERIAVCLWLAVAVVAVILILALRARDHYANKGKFCGSWDPASTAEMQALAAMSTYA